MLLPQHFFFNFTPQKRKDGQDNVRPARLRFWQPENNSLCPATISDNTADYLEASIAVLAAYRIFS